MQTFKNGLIEAAGAFRTLSKAIDLAEGNSVSRLELSKNENGVIVVEATIVRSGQDPSVLDTYHYGIGDGLVWQSLELVIK